MDDVCVMWQTYNLRRLGSTTLVVCGAEAQVKYLGAMESVDHRLL
jgi:hypothetical protein